MANSQRRESETALLRLDQLPAVLNPDELGTILRLGRSKTYELLRTGAIFSVRCGRSYKIPRRAVEKFLTEPEEGAPAGERPLLKVG